MRSFSEQEIREIRPQAEAFSSLTTVSYGAFIHSDVGERACARSDLPERAPAR